MSWPLLISTGSPLFFLNCPKTNPVLAPAFATGPAAVVAQLPLFGIVIVGLGGLTVLFNRASEREAAQLYRLSLLVLGGCALWGVILVGWNGWVLVSGLQEFRYSSTSTTFFVSS